MADAPRAGATVPQHRARVFDRRSRIATRHASTTRTTGVKGVNMRSQDAKQAGPIGGRWLQLAIGVVCMAMVANLQYGWTLFVDPIGQRHGWSRAAIQVAFTIFVVTETWLVPVEGWFVDKFGPRIVVLIGGILCAVAWALNAMADTLLLLYVAAAVGGVGAGAVYGTCIG